MASLSPVLSQRKNMAVIRLTTEEELAWWPPILMLLGACAEIVRVMYAVGGKPQEPLLDSAAEYRPQSCSTVFVSCGGFTPIPPSGARGPAKLLAHPGVKLGDAARHRAMSSPRESPHRASSPRVISASGNSYTVFGR